MLTDISGSKYKLKIHNMKNVFFEKKKNHFTKDRNNIILSHILRLPSGSEEDLKIFRKTCL